MSNLGQQVMEGIISGTLFSARCAHDEEHATVTVWSSGAAEQIEAMVTAFLKKDVGPIKDILEGAANAVLEAQKERDAALAKLRALESCIVSACSTLHFPNPPRITLRYDNLLDFQAANQVVMEVIKKYSGQ